MGDWLFILIMYILGLGLCVLEIFIPSGGVIGIAAVLCIVYALWHLVVAGYAGVAIICVIFTLAYVALVLRWGLRRFRMDTSLSDSVATGADVAEARNLVGCVGEALTPLRPSGMARFDGCRYDVVTRGGFIDRGAPVRVVETSGNRILVKPG